MKEELYKVMVKNLMKKNNYLNLSWMLDKEQITEDDFQVELDSNPELYLIEATDIASIERVNTVNEILQELEIELNIEDVSELFSIDPESLLSILEENENESDAADN